MIAPRKALLAGLLASAALFPAPFVRSAMAAPAQRGSEPVKIDYRRFTLPNGLTAIVYSDHSVPSVYVGIRYRTGSKDEPAGRSGFAHLFEHLMFQSTRNRKGDFLPALEAVGATDVNGQTTSDWTDYHETVPTAALDFALWMESDRMSHLADGITQQELEEQRGVVQNEKRQGELQPGAKAGDRYLAGFYPAGHPYAHSVIGSMEDLDRASLADVKQWFNDYYGASNAVIVLAGDIDFDAAKEKITRYFGAVRPGKAIDRVVQWLPAFGEVKRETLYDAVSSATISRSWPVSNRDPREKTLLQLAARTMAGGADTPLVRQLVEEQRVALGVGASLEESQLGSTFSLSMTLRPGVSPEQANAALDRAFDRFLAEGPQVPALRTVIANSDVALLRLMESAPAVGGWLLGSEVDQGDPTYFLKQRDWIGSATAAEVRSVAAKWLARPYYELRLLPSPLTAASGSDVDRSHPPAVASVAADVRFPPIHETRLANGLRIVVAERHRLPILDARLQFATGTLRDDAYKAGAARQAFGLMDEGSNALDATGFATRLAGLGGQFSADAGARQSAVRWSTTMANADAVFALAAGAVRSPAYAQARLDKAKEAIDPQFDAYQRNPIAAAGILFSHALWGADHPYGRLVARETLKQLDRAAVQRFHDAELGPGNATLYLIGDITLDQARSLAERHFGTWRPVHPGQIPQAPAPAATGPRVILVDAPGAPQTSITAGHFVGPYEKAQASTEMLMDAVLGTSFESRLNMNLRERRGWAYGFSAGIGDAVAGDRVFTASGTVQADKTAASMVEIRNEIRAYATTNPVREEELAREKDSAIHALPLGYSSSAAFLGAIVSADAHQLPLDYGQGTVARLSQVTLDAVRHRAAQTYRADAMTWVIVGDLARIEKDVRALDFGPVEVWDVFGKRLR